MGDVELFHTFHQAWSAGDLDRVLELADPDVVCRPVHALLYSAEEFRGRDGLARWFAEMTGPWDSFEARVEDVHQTDGGVLGFVHLVGHRGDRAFDARVASDCRIRDGRIVALIARDIWDAQEDLASSLR